jgi:hypothetical protein
MGRIKNALKQNWADFLSVNTFPSKQTSFLLDLSVLFNNKGIQTKVEHHG